MFAFNPRNPTGHYKLDLSHPWHNLLACLLAESSAAEKQRQKSLGLKDLSQKGNNECWRNETYEGEAFEYSPLTFQVPATGILELDYATFVRPPSKATQLPPA